MGGLLKGWRSAGVTIAATGALVVGSWLVVASATASTTSPTAAHHPVPTSPTRPATTGGAAPAASWPGTDPTTTGPLADTATGATGATGETAGVAPTTSSPAAASAGGSGPAGPGTTPPATVPVPPAPTAPAVATPPVVTPAVVGRARHGRGARHPLAGRHLGGGAPGQSSAQAAQVAAQLIHALDQHGAGHGGVPVTADNVALLARWIDNEGGLWADNPLNTSLDAGQYPHQFTSGGQDTGIPIFPTMAAGEAATATTMLSNPAYARIVKLLRVGTAPCLSFARAVIQSPWASSHYGYDTARFCSGVVPVPTHRRRGAA